MFVVYSGKRVFQVFANLCMCKHKLQRWNIASALNKERENKRKGLIEGVISFSFPSYQSSDIPGKLQSTG